MNGKRVITTVIITLICLFTTAQPLYRDSIQDPVTNTYFAALKQPTEVAEDNLIANDGYKLKDIDGNSYIAVKIGNQFWMAENLKVTKLNNGTEIPLVYYYKTWSNLITPGYCWYNNDINDYKAVYGALYNGYTVSTGKLCPVGWHVPTAVEWTILINYCGEDVVGGKLKDFNSRYWMNPNEGATNETGFTALPGGSRGNLGSFIDKGLRGHWWSSTDIDAANALNSSMSYSYSNVTGNSDQKRSGLSVRCVKDSKSGK